MPSKSRDGDVLVAISGKWVSWTHTVIAFTAFLGALLTGLTLHYHKIVQNEFYGYPDEWFPSVSATIGDRYPERSVFQLFIALTSGPRFLLVFLFYILTARNSSSLPQLIAGFGLFRTLTCGGWTYVTSTDDHGWHDIFMISYLVATIPWTWGCLVLSPPNPKALKYRKCFAGLFFATLVPLVIFFIRHKVHKVPGAYTTYAFFEWALIIFDIGFDAVTALDFDGFELIVRDVKGSRKGKSAVVPNSETEKGNPLKQPQSEGFSILVAVDALADTYNGFVFWSMLTSLGVTVWYFPLWHMGLSGWEALVIVSISPLLLAVRSYRSFAVRNVRYIHLLSLVGLLAYLVTNPPTRLIMVSFGVGMSCLTWAITFHKEKDAMPWRLQGKILGWVIGLIASSVAKFGFWTNNPIWPVLHAENGGWNHLGLALAVVSILAVQRDGPYSSALTPAGNKGSPALAACGVGGMLFSMHYLLCDSSTMISWVWEGYPVRGPLAVPHGVCTLLAMGAGLIFGSFYSNFARSWTFFGIGSIGAAVLTVYSHWLGFYGGLVLAFYITAIAPTIIKLAVRHSPGTTFGIGLVIYNFMVFASVWIVAYAFVPGGPVMREHNDWIMTGAMLLIGAGVFSASAITSNAHPKVRAKQRAPGGNVSRHYLFILVVLEILAILVAYLRFPSFNYTPYHPEQKLITAGIWTVHFSIDNDMWSSERRIRDVIKELEIDVIGLLESDLQRVIMGMRDTTQYLAEDLGMYVDYGPGPNKHTWGAALLSKFPILNSTHHLLPSPVGELAPAIHATLDCYGELVDVVVFHSGQEEDVEDRRLQAEYLSKLMGSSPRPLILLSYLVTKPNEGNYNKYVSERSGMKDIDVSDWDRWCEYILYKGLRRIGYARVSRSTITDTELQVGKFVVGEPEGTVDLIKESQVPEGQRFPLQFRGEGVRGHRYHVFDEPR
ncbi:MAG: hypothetical protein M1829_006707 [Trizodia sp. TS-e1964]|nr:MAG: hypothetical protein M1829_006707 [Trizodia sp. TS-e1964]